MGLRHAKTIATRRIHKRLKLMKYHIISLGCQMNQSDTERVKTVLHSMGYSPTDDEHEASILGVIACSVRQKAIDKVYSRIAKWNRLKNRKNLITFVSGCILPSDGEKFLKLFDLVFPMSELPDLPQMVSQYGIVTPSSLQFFSGEIVKPQPVTKDSGAQAGILQPVSIKGMPASLKLNPESTLTVSGMLIQPTVPISKPSYRYKTDATSFAVSVRFHTHADVKCRGLQPKSSAN